MDQVFKRCSNCGASFRADRRAEFCVACGSRSLIIPGASQTEAQPARSELIHFRQIPFPSAVCGLSGNISFHSDWQEVTCPNCLRYRGPIENKQRRDKLAKRGCLVALTVSVLVIAVCSIAVASSGDSEAECPYSVSDFGRIPRQTAEAASGLYGTDARLAAQDNNTQAWQIYARVYNDKVAAMQRECD